MSGEEAAMRILGRLLWLSALGGCAAGSVLPPGTVAEIQSFYRLHAIERQGACPSPELLGVVRVLGVEERQGTVRLRLRYAYAGERVVEPELGLVRRCSGFATREFVLDAETGAAVAMSGPVRRGRAVSPR